MKSLLLLMGGLLTYASAGTAPVSSAGSPAEAIVGTWLTADKVGTVQIYAQQARYFGKISGPNQSRLDIKNPDAALRRRPILGAVILQNFRFNGAVAWEDGTIYDPNNGKTYACVLRLPKPNTLEVRGYIGFSLLGRTEVWTHVP